MESTGLYWKPVWNILEGGITLLLANAHHIKAVPGRKTDVKDAEWIADLLRHGLIQGSFVPDRDGRELRELTRYRTRSSRSAPPSSTASRRPWKAPTSSSPRWPRISWASPGREMLDALVAGETDAAALAQFAQGRMRQKTPRSNRPSRGAWPPISASWWPSS